MARNVSYVQCTMRRSSEMRSVVTTSYIPQQFAKLGKVLKLRDHDVWVDGWVVESIGDRVVDTDELPDYHKAIKGHRNATGDSTRRSKN